MTDNPPRRTGYFNSSSMDRKLIFKELIQIVTLRSTKTVSKHTVYKEIQQMNNE